MAFDLVSVPAALVPEGQDVLIGDIRVLAGTRIARINGLTDGVLGDAPHDTLFGNLFTEDGPMRPFGMDRFIGDGLQYTTGLENGPFPEVVGHSEQSFTTAGTSVTVELPKPKLYDRYIVVTNHCGLSSVTTPTGWTLKSHAGLTDSDHNCYERIVDQNFIDAGEFFVTFVSSLPVGVLAKVWLVRYAHISLTSEILATTNTSTGGTSNDIGALTPSWVLANTLWLTAIGIEADDTSPPNVTAFPTGFTETGELQNVSATAAIDGAIAWGQLASRVTSVDPTAYTYAAARSCAILIAIPPRVTGSISVVPGGGTAGWDDVLLVDAHSGASNPIIDSPQFIQFGAGTMPGSGEIRTDSIWEARGTKDMKVTSGEAIKLNSVDSSEFICSGGQLNLQSDLTLKLNSVSSSMTLDASSNITATAGGDIHLHAGGAIHIGHTGLTDFIHLESDNDTDIVTGTNFSATAGGNASLIATSDVALTAGTVVRISPFAMFTEQAASTPVMTAGQALFWVRNDVPNVPMFTDDTNTDHVLAFRGEVGWDDVLLVDANSGTTNPVITTGQFLQFGSGSPPASGQLRSSASIEARSTAAVTLTGGTNATVQASADILLNAGGTLTMNAVSTTQLRSTGGTVFVLADTSTVQVRGIAADVLLIADATAVQITPATICRLAGAGSFLQILEKAASTPTVPAGEGLFWVKNNTPNDPFFTDDTNVDRQIATFPIPLSGFATIATDTFLGNVSGSTAAPSAVNLSTLAGAGLVFGTHTLDVTAGAGGSLVVSANDIQRAALTGAITASQDSNTTAFGALAAKSVLANATNASAVPAALAGSAAFQHLRVNSANTGLEWSAFTSGDFPAGVVPLTAHATQAANTIVANATAGVASPTAVTCGAESVFGQTSGNLQGIASSVQTALIRGSGSVFWASAAADQVLRRSGTGDLGFGTLVTNNIGNNQVTNALLAQAGANTFKGNITGATANVSDVAFSSIDSTSIIFDATSHTLQRAAFTGDVTAAQNSNATTIATGVVTNAKLATMAANTLKVNLTGATAAPTDSSLSSTLDALADPNERVFLARDAAGWDGQFQTEMLAYLNLPTVGAACTVPFFDEDFNHLVLGTLGTAAIIDPFVGITNGSTSEWACGPDSGGGTITITAVPQVDGHNGIIQVQTGAASGNDLVLYRPARVRFDRTVLVDFWVKLSATTSETFRIGMMQNETQASGGTDSVCFQFDPAISVDYQTITRSASGTATVTTLGSFGGSSLWRKFTIWRESSTSVKFYINNLLASTHTTQIPTGLLFIAIYLKANTTGGKTIQVDKVRAFVDDATLLT